MKDVLSINKKNLEESKQMQQNALTSNSVLLTASENKTGRASQLEEDKEPMLLSQSQHDFMERQPGQRLNNSTFLRGSEVSNSTIRITTTNNRDSTIEEEKNRQPLLYRTQ